MAFQESTDITQFVLDSRNKTFRVFAEAYKPIAAKSKPLIEQFYANITDSISLNQTRTKDTLAMGTSQLEALSRNLGSFFTNLFPIIYKNIMLDNQDSQFTADYTQCLNNLMNNINPYDKLDQTVTQKVIHMLKSTRVLFNSIQYTMTKTREADQMFVQNLNKCESLVVKMNLCTWCSTDFNTRVRSIENSCWRYATNLATACLPSSREQLGKVWYSFMNTMASYVSSIEQSRLDVDIAGFLFALHNKISDVIMFSMQDTSNIDKKVRYACGPPQYVPADGSTPRSVAAPTAASAPKASGLYDKLNEEATPLYTSGFEANLTSLASLLMAGQGRYSGLDERIFDARGEDRPCWSGETMGEYNKTVGLFRKWGEQKSNPDNAQTSLKLESRSYVLAEEEGSGSGGDGRPLRGRQEYRPSDDEEDEDVGEFDAGSGSGDGPDGLRPRILEDPKGINPLNPLDQNSTTGGNSTQNKNAATPSLAGNWPSLLLSSMSILMLRYWQ
ncbi:hypothetical protein M8J75_003239 [Diaphorina citri]|nr:hypothetical protein M8J75_003239 [Diaphorina citri]